MSQCGWDTIVKERRAVAKDIFHALRLALARTMVLRPLQHQANTCTDHAWLHASNHKLVMELNAHRTAYYQSDSQSRPKATSTSLLHLCHTRLEPLSENSLDRSGSAAYK